MTNDLVPSEKKKPYKPMSAQKKRFCEYYMGEHRLDAKAAAIAAGYSEASLTGKYQHLLLRNAAVQEYIRELVNDSDFGVELAPRAVWDATVARSIFDPLKLEAVDENDFIRLKKLSELPLHIRQCIKTVKEIEKTDSDGCRVVLRQYEFYDALKASELIGRWSGMDNQRDPLIGRNDPQPVWAGIVVAGLPAERSEDPDDQTREQREEGARQVRALSTIEPGDQIIEVPIDQPGETRDHDRSGTFEH